MKEFKVSSEEFSKLTFFQRLLNLTYKMKLVTVIGTISSITAMTITMSVISQEKSSIYYTNNESIKMINKLDTLSIKNNELEKSVSTSIKNLDGLTKIDRDKYSDIEKKLKIIQLQIEESNRVKKQIVELMKNENLEKNEPKKSSLLYNIFSITEANAADENKVQIDNLIPKVISKIQILLLVLALLAMVYLVSIISLLISRDPKKVDLSADVIKTLTGFFIGVATTMAA